MRGSKAEQKGLQKEETLQAVLIADNYDNLFSDYTKEKSPALLPIVGRCAINYALEQLGRCGIQETIIYCSTNANEVKKHVAKLFWSQSASPMKIIFVVSEECESLGDAIRDIDNKAIIKGNFVLLNALTVTNVKLLDAIAFHSEKCSKDKGTAMTLLLQDVGTRTPRFSDDIFAINAVSDRLLLQSKGNSNKKVDIPLESVLSNQNINIFSNFIDSGIAICSPSVPILFSDNFDFQTKDDFIRGVLLNEEIMDSRIYCYQITDGYGSTIHDWPSYQRVSNDIIHRWTFPFVPDQSFSNGKPYYQLRNYIYKQQGVHLLKSVILETDVVIGEGSQIESSSRIVRSVIGRNCHIGKNVDIRDSFIFDNCIITDNCKIQLSVIGEGSVIKESSFLTQCFLKRTVVINPKSNLTGMALKATSDAKVTVENEGKVGDLDLDSDDEFNMDKPLNLIDPEMEYFEEDFGHSSESDSEGFYPLSQEPDDNTIFYTEVLESLHRGFEEKVACENLILEINSSRYAYNIILKDVTNLTVRAIFSIPERVGSKTKPVLIHFLPLFKNYIKTIESQMDCLKVMEDMFEELGNELPKCIQETIHFLYDNDVLLEDVILKWHKSLDADSEVRLKVAPLIKWLEEAAEESSEEESE